MKKHNYLRKALSLALMLTMLASMACIGVSANIVWENPIFTIFAPDIDNPEIWYQDSVEIANFAEGIIVSAADYESFIQPWKHTGAPHEVRDITLELAGVKKANWNDINSYEEWKATLDPFTNNEDSVEIPVFPFDGTQEERLAWYEAYAESFILVNYVAHRHNLQGSQMYFDDNYHWQLCTECANRVYLANHTDKDADGKCDFCGNAIRYYNVTVKDATGGKVTLSANKGAMNEKITVTVTPDAGYHLEKLNFVNANAMHSKRAVWEDMPNAEYHFFISNWDVEVEAIFIQD